MPVRNTIALNECGKEGGARRSVTDVIDAGLDADLGTNETAGGDDTLTLVENRP